jgi:hypothetical protein
VEASDLEELDRKGVDVLDAITYSRPPPGGSHASPHAFVFPGGRTYWVKRTAQQGLVAELVAGQLGAAIDAAPMARVVSVSANIAPPEAKHLVGVGVGVEDAPGMENLRHLQQALPAGTLDPANLDIASRLRVLAFQTWIGVGDTQILVDLRNGRLLSIDHGEWCSDPSSPAEPLIVSTPGVADDVGRDSDDVEDAVGRISGLTDENLLEAVAQVPDGTEWNSAPARRLQLAEWLAFRRDRLAEVVRRWARS